MAMCVYRRNTYSDRVFYFRLQTLITDGGTEVLRNIFDQSLRNQPLNVFLANEKTNIMSLRRRKIMTAAQFKILYPKCGPPENSQAFDISLFVCLLRNLPNLGLNQNYNWNIQPGPFDQTIEANICRLRGFRNAFASTSSTTVFTQSSFQTKLNEIEQVLLRLNSAMPKPLANFSETIHNYAYSPIDPKAEEELETTIHQWREMEKSLGTEIKQMKRKMEKLEKNMKKMKDSIPKEILRMDRNSIELYKRALSEGKETVYNIRVMIVGHYGVGKTTLKKRLFGEDVDIGKRESTNGIEVHVKRCKVSLDTGQWNKVEKDKKAEMVYHRLIKFLQTTNTTHGAADEREVDMEEVNFGNDGNLISGENQKFPTDREPHSTETARVNIGPDDYTTEKTNNSKETPKEVKTEPKDEHVSDYLKKLSKECQFNYVDNSEFKTADLSVWDFAGQFVFYATHQVFLSRKAVYLLVTDISKSAEDVVADRCYVDSKGAHRLKISEFVDFWLNSIHEYCDTSDEGPPVILVGTFADKLNAETKDHTVKEFFCELRGALANKTTFCHLTKKYFALDNSTVDSNIETLKKTILETASKQTYWGETIPAKWITLERLIVTDNGPKILGKDKLRDVNRTLPFPIETEEELELFLKFHHESGNLLYFCDDNLQGNIILDPQWLVDAFKSLITAKEFCSEEQTILQKWVHFNETAILTNELVEAIWAKAENFEFHEHKELLLNYLEKLGIIAKPIQHSNSDEVVDYFFAPSVLKATPPDDLLVCRNYENQQSTSKLCFKTPSGFLHMAVFNKLLAACIHQWPLSRWRGRPKIFCGCGIFDLQDNHTLYIYFYDHVIQIWLTRLSTSGQQPDRNLCLEVKTFVLDLLRNKFRMKSNICVFVKCQTAVLHSSEDAFAVNEIAQKTEVVCSCRMEGHALRVHDILKYWQVEWSPENIGNMSRLLTEKDLSRISQEISEGWQHLGFELGISKVQMDHIRVENERESMRIYCMLEQWHNQNPLEATVKTLYNAMKNCSQLTFDKENIERVFAGF